MIYFYNFSKKGMIIDPVADVSRLRALSAHISNHNNANLTLSCDKEDTTAVVATAKSKLAEREFALSNKHEDNCTNCNADVVVLANGANADTSQS